MQFLAKVLLAAALSMTAGAARAQVYRYVDPGTGWFIYSNRRAELSAPSHISVPPSLLRASVSTLAPERERERRVPKKTAAAGFAPADFPRVTHAVQRERDSDRRRILQEELESEKSVLDAAVAKGASEDIVHRHQANIAAIEREIARTP